MQTVQPVVIFRQAPLHLQADPIANPSTGPYTYEPVPIARANPAANPSHRTTDTFSVSFT